MFRAPLFWQKKEIPLWAYPLKFIACLYEKIAARKIKKTIPYKARVPVVCVGNITLGGTGKTPIVRDLARSLLKAGYKVGILSRGYGGRLKGPIRVNIHHHTALDVGDEPLLLSKTVPTWVSKDKVQGAQLMTRKGIDLILMDDGHQNPTLHKDFSLVVIDGEAGFGNECVFPLGPLRERVAEGASRADGLIVVGGAEDKLLSEIKTYHKPIFQAEFETDLGGIDKEGAYFAFAGIGRPKKFFESLTKGGIFIAGTKSFKDHYDYKDRDLDMLEKQAKKNKSILLTTEKDFMRLSKKQRKGVLWAPLHVRWKDKKSLLSLVEDHIKNE